MGHIAGGTSTIRVSSRAASCCPTAPLVVAETFGTLAELYPGRIDLGLGAHPAPTGQPCVHCAATAQRPRRTFRATWLNCSACWDPASRARNIVDSRARRGHANVPIWLLGSSLFSAQLAAHGAALCVRLALRTAHAAPRALDICKRLFQPSARLARPTPSSACPWSQRPRTMRRSSSPAAPTSACWAFSQASANCCAASRRLHGAAAATRARGHHRLPREAGVVGGPATVHAGLQALADATQADEFMLVSDVFDPQCAALARHHGPGMGVRTATMAG
ncbi:MAG: LLM class flavin-dependent oxidoreductase [Paenacidovorax caeni]